MTESENYKYLIITGPVIHALSFGELDIIEKAAIKVDIISGKIVSLTETIPEIGEDCKVIKLGDSEFLCPGFIDTHHHAPQTANLGLGLDKELLQWLDRYTFPREKSFGDRSKDSIKKEYSEMAQRLIRGGTTSCVYFGSLQLEANEILVDALIESGQRAFIGKVCMDQNSPADYIESTTDSITRTRDFISYIKSKNSPLISPVVTPRFAPTCSMTLMKELGAISKEHSCHIQTHLSENLAEIAWVKELFPSNQNYSQVYDEAGLLANKTILAHAIYLEDTEKSLIKERGAAISHCPNSNFALSSGCLNIRDLLDKEIKVSLGTDVSGGYSTSILDACRQAIITSKVVHFQNREKYRPLSAVEAFSLATLNGAICLNLQDSLGNLLPGKFFDALIVNVHANPQIPIGPESSLQNLLEKFIFCGDDRCISHVFVQGRQLK
jgi:guanine deaminase